MMKLIKEYYYIIPTLISIIIALCMYFKIKSEVYATEEDKKNELIEKILKEVPTLEKEKLNELNLESLEKIIDEMEEEKRKEIEKEIFLKK